MKREDEVELAGRVSLFTLFKTREFRREEREEEEEGGASVIFPPLRVFSSHFFVSFSLLGAIECDWPLRLACALAFSFSL